MEMSLEPLYAGETLFPDMHKLLNDKGYKLISIEHEFSDPHTGQLLQINGVFHRNEKK